MADSDYTIETVDNTAPPPWFHTPNEWLPGIIDRVELTDHEKFGAGFRFHLYIEGDNHGDTIWYTTGRSKSSKNKLGKIGTAVYGTLDAVPNDVRDFQGLGIAVMFEHIQPADKDDHWQEKILGIKGRELSEEEELVNLVKAGIESPF